MCDQVVEHCQVSVRDVLIKDVGTCACVVACSFVHVGLCEPCHPFEVMNRKYRRMRIKRKIRFYRAD
eukprot:9424601-Pyramimonas_sp.AAC.1